ncbi:hypothetical protein GCM10020229_49080 [Kitasatospora albolonga]|uniref:hypothetical protein n=1 Tax=Kitasatospora albolonga TaxID=68173 RepID=UPI0031EAA838
MSEAGRAALAAFVAGLSVGFAGIRVSARLIRAGVRWWPGNVRLGGLHVHHVVFGVVLMAAAGVAGLVVPDGAGRVALAAAFGAGTGLVLDEFALILHLEDVYWTARGRVSLDAVCVALALAARPLLGPGLVGGQLPYVLGWLPLAVVTVLKGKYWTGLAGVFCPPLLLLGAARLSRPGAPWARRCYRARPDKRIRAERRERTLRAPAMAAKVRAQEWLAGRHDLPDLTPAPAAAPAHAPAHARAAAHVTTPPAVPRPRAAEVRGPWRGGLTRQETYPC